jgi:cytochrome c biogenesis protein CcdA
MDRNNPNNTQKKSLKERFLLVIGIFFFVVYLACGLAVLFWKGWLEYMPSHYRTALGVIIIVYGFLRFIRFFQKQ